jgi:hypothetical protein
VVNTQKNAEKLVEKSWKINKQGRPNDFFSHILMADALYMYGNNITTKYLVIVRG